VARTIAIFIHLEAREAQQFVGVRIDSDNIEESALGRSRRE